MNLDMRRILIAANWKMHKTLREAQEFVQAFLPQVQAIREIEVALAPSFTALATVSAALQNSNVRLAAQNMHFASEGPYTGEISPVMLRDLGCTYVIVGHSERRQHFAEDEGLINQKLIAAFRHGLVPILCVGETLEERRGGATQKVLEQQLRADVRGLTEQQTAQLVIAYEPIWAIGTGETASPLDAEEGARFLRELITELYAPATAESVRIQYGGSVKPENAEDLIAQPNVDGALVGGASLDPHAFAEIVKAAERVVA
jgi:triosephosphate isomerase